MVVHSVTLTDLGTRRTGVSASAELLVLLLDGFSPAFLHQVDSRKLRMNWSGSQTV